MIVFLRKARLCGVTCLFILGLAIISVGCNPSPSDNFILQVQIRDAQTEEPLARAEVVFNVGGKVPPAVYSDVHGKAIVEVDESYADKFIKITVSKEGYESQDQHVQVLLNALPIEYRLDSTDVAVASILEPTPDEELIPTQMPTPIDTAVPLPTHTLTALPNNTPAMVPTKIIPTNTPESVSVNDPIVVNGRVTGNGIEIYTTPSVFTGVRALFQNNDSVVVMAKTTDEKWYYVKRVVDNVEGWVEAVKIQLTEGTPSDIPEDTIISNNEPIPNPVSEGCSISVDVVFEAVDQVRIRWEDLPAGTNNLYLIVSGLIADTSQYLVYPNYIDINDPHADGFVIEGWKFSERSFNTGTTFNYSLQAQDSAGNDICIARGSFDK